MLVGFGVGLLLIYVLIVEQLESWGWCLLFVVGLLLVLIGNYICCFFDEIVEVEYVFVLGQLGKWVLGVLSEILQVYCKLLLLGMVIVIGGIFVNYIVMYYIIIYVKVILYMLFLLVLWVFWLVGLLQLLLCVLVGILIDCFGCKLVVIWLCLVLIVLVFLVFMLMNYLCSGMGLLMVVMVMVIFMVFILVFSVVMMIELFLCCVWVIGLVLCYGLGVLIFGGFLQFIVIWLVKVIGFNLGLVWYVIGIGFILLVVIVMVWEMVGWKLD